MPSYRFYPLDARQAIAGPAEDVVLADDEAACAHARMLLDRHEGAQVWQGGRLVHCATRPRAA